MKKQKNTFLTAVFLLAVIFSACDNTVEAPSYTVIYNANGGTGEMGNSVFTYGQFYNLRACTYTMPNHSFAGWAENKTGGMKYTDHEKVKNLTKDKSITLYAVWSIDQCTINYNSNNATSGNAPNPQTANYGTAIKLPGQGSLLRSAYGFAGWNTNAAGTGANYAADSDYTVTADTTLYARWVSQYTVSFDSNGAVSGSAPAAQEADPGKNIILPGQGSMVKTGYTFGGWNTNIIGTGTNYDANASYTPAGNVTLYAKWTANTLSISYANGGGSGSAPAGPASAAYATSVTVPANTYTRTGYTFSGWAVSGTGSIAGTHAAGASVPVANLSTAIANGNASITLTATWTEASGITVSFDNQNGDGTANNISVTYNQAYGNLPSGLTRIGYTFSGWWTAANGGGTEVTSVTLVSNPEPHTLYAKWTANILTISYANGGGSGTAPTIPVSAAYGTSVTMPANTYTRTGYTFVGWAVSGTGYIEGTHAAGASVPVTNLSSVIASGDAGITLTASWTANTLSIIYANGGGSGSAPTIPVSAAYGTSVTMPANTYTRTGYTFSGWAVSGTGYIAGTHAAGASVPVANLSSAIANGNAIITLTAVWTANTLSISYANGGGTGSAPIEPVTAAYRTNVTIPANTFTSPNGLPFIGWAVSGTGYIAGTYAAGASVPVANLSTAIANGNASITLTATWTEASGIVVSFDKQNGDGTANNISVTYNQAYGNLPSGLTRTGYAFGGWWTAANGGGTEVTSATLVNNLEPHTLYAKWTAYNLTISYSNGGGSGSAPTIPVSAAYGTNVTMPTNTYTRTGYTFASWSVSGTGSIAGTHAAGASVPVANLSTAIASGDASITLTASWIVTTYTVTFNSNGGSTVNAISDVEHGSSITKPADPEKAGFTFVGWYSDDNIFTNPWTFTNGITENMTLYAKWLLTYFTSVEDASEYLASQQGGLSADDPIILPLKINLGTMTQYDSGWRQLLDVMQLRNKFVDLDLSLCTMNGTEFNPYYYFTIGKNRITSIALPNAATSIAAATSSTDAAFRYFSALEKFSGMEIKSIGDYAFSGCTKLALTSLPAGITFIGKGAFRDCTSLALTSLPTGITSIGDNTFSGCTKLALTSLPAGIASIGITAFESCTKLALTSLPTGLTSIGNGAFYDCTNITLTSLPAGITSIGNTVFYGCANLALTSLPTGLTSIGSMAFQGCTKLTLTSLPAGITSIANSAFQGCTNLALTSLPTGITSIAESVFSSCTNLALISLPTGLTSIGQGAFYYCTKLAFTSLPDGITSIGSLAFGRTNLTLIELPAGITSIGLSAFSNCTSLTLITCYAITPPALGSNVFSGSNPVIKVPSASVEAYKTAPGWSEYAAKIEAIE